MLPVNERPEYSEGYEGFFMLDEINGTSAEVDIIYLIRDFFKDSFNEKKKILQDIVDFLNKKYGQRIESVSYTHLRAHETS